MLAYSDPHLSSLSAVSHAKKKSIDLLPEVQMLLEEDNQDTDADDDDNDDYESDEEWEEIILYVWLPTYLLFLYFGN